MKAESSKGTRGTFSNFGFLMASVGSAVGLGNLWKFPYLTGTNGGGIFVLIYLCILLTVGFACMLGEMTIGRFTKLNPIGAYKKIAKKYTFAGVIGVVVAFLIVTYYNIIGGWILKYLFSYITGQSKFVSASSESFFGSFISSPFEPILWTFIFIVINLFILKAGVIKGIERASKFMMPLLFVLLIVTAIRSVTLPGAVEGIKFFLKPDLSKLSMSTVSAALGQVFFSLSLGMGITITYGSYLSDSANLEKNAVMVPLFDTIAAILSGFAILPAVFAFGFDPSEGPGLIFVTLPSVFGSMPGGVIFGSLFFLLVLFAAITSSLSLLEVPTSYLIDNKNWDRKKAVYVLSAIIFLISIPESLSNGVWEMKFFGMTFFDFVGYIAEAVLMPLCGLLMCIVIGHVWGTDKATEEITNHGTLEFKAKSYWSVLIKYIAPVLILLIWLNSTGILSLLGLV
ncbi:sodium-dependent transporter [Peptoniphilus sp.]|jgi:NSS family neurotransmitter:Na+ symporter|uniref:sodium-dependent transporter n=1 Tax=Peptoniphilus sp. TaxID=1971214 RepID=UPI003D8ABB03